MDESQPAAVDLTAIWDAASWVANVTDPSLVMDRLHATFETVVFSAMPQEDEDDEDANGSEDGEESEELEDDFKEAANDLLDDAAEDDDEGSNVFSNISDNEAEEMLAEGFDTADAAAADEFNEWIQMGFQDEAPGVAATEAPGARVIESELQRVGLSGLDAIVERDVLPERYKLIALREQRDKLQAMRLEGGVGIEIPFVQEAVWILRQLQKPGFPFHRSSVVVALLSEDFEHLSRHSIVLAIVHALRMMLKESLEPAHLMLYHQHQLAPLLYALWADRNEDDELEPNPSFSYCLSTGRRQKPVVTARTVHNSEYAGVADGPTRDIGGPSADPTWQAYESSERHARVKPCIIELGRLLIEILELDILCHRLEHLRQLHLRRLRALGSIASDQVRLLEDLVFESVAEAEAWGAFASFLGSLVDANNSSAMGPTRRLNKNIALSKAFEEFALTGLQYHENLCEGRCIYTLPGARERPDLYTWARHVGLTASAGSLQLRADQVIELFSKAVVEQYTRLPILRKRVYAAFCSEGELLVTYLRPQADQRRFKTVSVQSLINDAPGSYFDLVEQERCGFVTLYFHLDHAIVRGVMGFNSLCGCGSLQDDDDQWVVERRTVLELVVNRIIEATRPSVRNLLERVAQNAARRTSCRRFGAFCAEGPYEPTKLKIEAYDPARRTWESEWNAAEALPQADSSSLQTNGVRRTCAAFRGENGVTCFTFIDEFGAVLGQTRWRDRVSDEEGRRELEAQNLAFLTLVRHYAPSVVGVAAVSSDAIHLMNQLEKLVRERLHSRDHVHLPVVWVSPLVALVASRSCAAEASMPSADSVSRASVSLARYLQNPLSELCELFDARRSVLKLPLGVHTLADKNKLVEALQWEVTLWVNAVGVSVSDVVKMHSPVATLQFVAGFGPRKAMRFAEFMRVQPLTSRSMVGKKVEEWFGPLVKQNCVPVLRVSEDGTYGEDGDDTYHPLDKTLIPTSWYEAAAVIAATALETPLSYDENCQDIRFDLSSPEERAIAVALFLLLPEEEKRDRFRKSINFKILSRCHETRAAWAGIQEGELLLILHELISNGRSFMRRPFRLMSSRLLFKLISGVSFVPKSDATRRLPASDPLIIREGDVVQGTVFGLRGGAIQGIKVATTRGVMAFMSLEDIDDGVMKTELQDYLRYTEDIRFARQNGAPLPEKRQCPKWLERHAVIQGVAVSCNYERCELRMRWCKMPETIAEPLDYMTTQGIVDAGRGVDIRSVNSVLTAQILEAAQVNALKISRHDLFKNISKEAAHDLLKDKAIGECLIRPSKVRRNEAIICVKVGNSSIANWPVREERVSSGNVVYHIVDRRTNRRHVFNDADHCLDAFIKRAVERAQSIRQHRKFVSDVRDVRQRLDEDDGHGRGLSYCFAEVIDDERPQTFYRLYYRIGGSGNKSLKIHLDHQHLHLRLPKSTGEVEWVPCSNAEQLSAIMKAYIESSLRSASRRRD